MVRNTTIYIYIYIYIREVIFILALARGTNEIGTHAKVIFILRHCDLLPELTILARGIEYA